MSINWQRSEPRPALIVHPPAAASLDEAHAAIEQWEFYSGKTLDSSQRLAVELMMAETVAGKWAARTTGRTVSRQNGKGDEIEVVEAWGLTQRAEAIVHTAHEIPTAKSAHARLVGHIEGHRDLRRRLAQVRYANGDQSIEMHNGGIVVYRTRTSGGGRGLDDISRLVVDEAQHAQPEQLASSTPIMAANPNPQVNFTGSAGISGKSEWWWAMRRRALAPDAGNFAWLEHSAEVLSLRPDGGVQSDRPEASDRDAWYVANPAYPVRVEDEYLEEQLRILGPVLFSREHLGVWDPDLGSQAERIWSPGVWETVCAQVPKPEHGLVFVVAVNQERSAASIGWASAGGTCGLVQDKAGVARRAGVGWVVPELVRIAKQREARVGVSSQDGSLLLALEQAGLQVHPISPAEQRAGCVWFFDSVIEQKVVVQKHPDLTSAVASATKRQSGDGFVWDRRAGDVSALVAVTDAAYMAQSDPAPADSVYESRGFVVL